MKELFGSISRFAELKAMKREAEIALRGTERELSKLQPVLLEMSARKQIPANENGDPVSIAHPENRKLINEKMCALILDYELNVKGTYYREENMRKLAEASLEENVSEFTDAAIFLCVCFGSMDSLLSSLIHSHTLGILSTFYGWLQPALKVLYEDDVPDKIRECWPSLIRLYEEGPAAQARI